MQILLNSVAHLYHYVVEYRALVRIDVMTSFVDNVNVNVRTRSQLLHLLPHADVHPTATAIHHCDGNIMIQLVHALYHRPLGPAKRLCHCLEGVLSTKRRTNYSKDKEVRLSRHTKVPEHCNDRYTPRRCCHRKSNQIVS